MDGYVIISVENVVRIKEHISSLVIVFFKYLRNSLIAIKFAQKAGTSDAFHH